MAERPLTLVSNRLMSWEAEHRSSLAEALLGSSVPLDGRPGLFYLTIMIHPDRNRIDLLSHLHLNKHMEALMMMPSANKLHTSLRE